MVFSDVGYRIEVKLGKHCCGRSLRYEPVMLVTLLIRLQIVDGLL